MNKISNDGLKKFYITRLPLRSGIFTVPESLIISDNAVSLDYKGSDVAGDEWRREVFTREDFVSVTMQDAAGLLELKGQRSILFICLKKGISYSRDREMTILAVNALRDFIDNGPLRLHVRHNHPGLWDRIQFYGPTDYPLNREYWKGLASLSKVSDSSIVNQGKVLEDLNLARSLFQEGVILSILDRQMSGFRKLEMSRKIIDLNEIMSENHVDCFRKYIAGWFIDNQEHKNLLVRQIEKITTDVFKGITRFGIKDLYDSFKRIGLKIPKEWSEQAKSFAETADDWYPFLWTGSQYLEMLRLQYILGRYPDEPIMVREADKLLNTAFDKYVRIIADKAQVEGKEKKEQEDSDSRSFSGNSGFRSRLIRSLRETVLLKAICNRKNYDNFQAVVSMTKELCRFRDEIINPPDKRWSELSLVTELEWVMILKRFFSLTYGFFHNEKPWVVVRKCIG